MKKKTYLRIRALILVLLLILSSLIIDPEQVLADTEVVANEETTQVTAEEETTQTTVNEEVTEVISNSENQNDSEQSNNIEESDTGIYITDEPQEKTAESATETDPDSAESPSEPELDPVEETEASASATVEATNETDDVTSEATTLPTTESTSADDSQSTEHNAEGSDDTDTDTLPTVESPEAEQTMEEAIADKQDAENEMPDPAERSIGTRANFTPAENFEFDPVTGTITRYIGAGKNVHIPPYINGVEVEHIGKQAFYDLQLTGVTIPYGVVTIGEQAFRFNILTEITIPNGVISIEGGAFLDNSLTSVTLPNSVKNIGDWAFARNKIKNVIIPDSVIWIDEWAFSFNELTSVTISKNVTFIGCVAFHANNLTSVTIPDSLSSIGKGAFSDNPISRALIPENIIFITKGEGETLVYQPTIEQVGEHCFDEGVPLIGKHYIKANYNIRKSPNGEVITVLWRPLYVTGTSTSKGQWLKFTYNGSNAYVSMAATTTNFPPITGYAKGSLNLRDAPGGSIIGTIPIGHQVQGVLVGNSVETIYNGKFGYVYASLLQKDPVKISRYIKAGSNIRSTPGGTIITKLKMPIYVTGTIVGSYLRFTYNGKTAYVHLSVTTTQSQPITGYTKCTVNVRSSPNGSIIGSLPAGRKVSGTLVGNWVKFTSSGKTGYIYSSYLR